MPNRPWFWNPNLIREKASTLLALASAAHSAVGRRARTTIGLVTAATSGIRSTQVECAPPAFTSGMKPSAFRVPAGHRIRNGTRSDLRYGIPLRLVAEIKGCSDDERTLQELSSPRLHEE